MYMTYMTIDDKYLLYTWCNSNRENIMLYSFTLFNPIIDYYSVDYIAFD